MFDLFLSFNYSNQAPISSYQISLQGIQETDTPIYPDAINSQLESSYFYSLFKCLPTECMAFLEFHFQKYIDKNPGKELDFLFFIEETSTNTLYFRSFVVLDLHSNPTVPKRQLLINEWVERKRVDLKTSVVQDQVTSIPDKKKKSVKMNDLNKPVLNQSQISILFSIMKDLNIISNRDLSKKTYSEIIQTLTGYSENTLRTNFSASQLIEISKRPEDYQEIIDNLYRIIEKLERAKAEITTSK